MISAAICAPVKWRAVAAPAGHAATQVPQPRQWTAATTARPDAPSSATAPNGQAATQTRAAAAARRVDLRRERLERQPIARRRARRARARPRRRRRGSPRGSSAGRPPRRPRRSPARRVAVGSNGLAPRSAHEAALVDLEAEQPRHRHAASDARAGAWIATSSAIRTSPPSSRTRTPSAQASSARMSSSPREELDAVGGERGRAPPGAGQPVEPARDGDPRERELRAQARGELQDLFHRERRHPPRPRWSRAAPRAAAARPRRAPRRRSGRPGAASARARSSRRRPPAPPPRPAASRSRPRSRRRSPRACAKARRAGPRRTGTPGRRRRRPLPRRAGTRRRRWPRRAGARRGMARRSPSGRGRRRGRGERRGTRRCRRRSRGTRPDRRRARRIAISTSNRPCAPRTRRSSAPVSTSTRSEWSTSSSTGSMKQLAHSPAGKISSSRFASPPSAWERSTRITLRSRRARAPRRRDAGGAPADHDHVRRDLHVRGRDGGGAGRARAPPRRAGARAPSPPPDLRRPTRPARAGSRAAGDRASGPPRRAPRGTSPRARAGSRRRRRCARARNRGSAPPARPSPPASRARRGSRRRPPLATRPDRRAGPAAPPHRGSDRSGRGRCRWRGVPGRGWPPSGRLPAVRRRCSRLSIGSG